MGQNSVVGILLSELLVDMVDSVYTFDAIGEGVRGFSWLVIIRQWVLTPLYSIIQN